MNSTRREASPPESVSGPQLPVDSEATQPGSYHQFEVIGDAHPENTTRFARHHRVVRRGRSRRVAAPPACRPGRLGPDGVWGSGTDARWGQARGRHLSADQAGEVPGDPDAD